MRNLVRPALLAAAALLPCAPAARAQDAGPALVAVALSGRDSVVLLDAHTLARVATLPVGGRPHEVAASPDGRYAYVADTRGATITVIERLPSPRVAATWRLPDSVSVHDVAASGDGRTVWAASGVRRLLLELDAATGAVRRTHALGRAGSWMVEPTDDGGAVVAHLEGGAVTLLNAAGAQTVLAAREGEIDATVSPDGRELWSVNITDGHVTVFDRRTGAVSARWPTGAGAGRVRFTPDGRRALVVVDGADSLLATYDARTRERTGVVRTAGGPKVVAVSRDGRRAYLTHPERDRLTLVDLAAMTVLRSVPLPGVPDGVAVLEPLTTPTRGSGTPRTPPSS